jgi:Flp pilus assembly pilin Flp
VAATITQNDGGGEKQMTKRIQKMFRRAQRKSAQSLVEYALILALISVVAILVLRGIGTSVNTKLSNVNGNLG